MLPSILSSKTWFILLNCYSDIITYPGCYEDEEYPASSDLTAGCALEAAAEAATPAAGETPGYFGSVDCADSAGCADYADYADSAGYAGYAGYVGYA